MRTWFVLAGLVASAAVGAAEEQFYMGIGASGSNYRLEGATDRDDTGFKLITGVALKDSLDLELSYMDHGRATLPSGIACIALVGTDCPDTSRLSAKSTSLFAVGHVGSPSFRLLAKAGFSHTTSRLRTAGVEGFGDTDRDLKFAWGFGAQIEVGRFAARAEYERFRIMQDRKLKAVSVSLLYTFP